MVNFCGFLSPYWIILGPLHPNGAVISILSLKLNTCMWTRRLSASISGMSEQDFGKGLLLALKLPEVQDALQDIMSRSHTDLKNEIVLLRKELKAKNDRIEGLEKRIQELETETDNLQQYSRRNSVRIAGIPEVEGEDPVARSLSVINETLQVDPPIQITDVDRIHRVGPKTAASRPMLIKFSTYLAKKRVMEKRSSLRGTRYFLNEDLTRHRAHLCYQARLAKKANKIQSVWTADGKILVRNNHKRIVTISSAQDLEKECLIPPSSPSRSPHDPSRPRPSAAAQPTVPAH